jgi:hypothetical protein
VYEKKAQGRRIPSPGGEGRVRGLLIQNEEEQEEKHIASP